MPRISTILGFTPNTFSKYLMVSANKEQSITRPTFFGTDGIRGVANSAPMDSETVMRLGRAIAHVFRRGGGRRRILIGKDTRISGYMLETALQTGISSMGVDSLLLGPLPTPGVAFMTRSMRADAGVMISASHNPFRDNGIKFFGGDGFKLSDETEAEIERLMLPGALDDHKALPEKIGKARRIEDAIGRYTVYLKSCVERECRFEGMKLVIDAAHGAAYKVAPMVYKELGVEVIVVGNQPDGININNGYGSLHPERIASLVREHGADAGVAFDGDADRALFCDEKGNILDGDHVLGICALQMKQQGHLQGNGVVGTVMSNLGLERALQAKGVAFHRTQVGDRYVLAAMKDQGLVLGGEQSGHTIFLEHNTTGDGILSSLMLFSLMIKSGKPLSELRDVFTAYPQKLNNVVVKEKKPLSQLPEITKVIEDAEKQLGNKGRILLRYSGTESKIRVMVEAEDESLCNNVIEQVTSVVIDVLQ